MRSAKSDLSLSGYIRSTSLFGSSDLDWEQPDGAWKPKRSKGLNGRMPFWVPNWVLQTLIMSENTLNSLIEKRFFLRKLAEREGFEPSKGFWPLRP